MAGRPMTSYPSPAVLYPLPAAPSCALDMLPIVADPTGREDRGSPDVAHFVGIGDPVTERRTKRLREHYCDPVKDFNLRRAHRFDGNAPGGPSPDQQRCNYEDQ